MEVNYIEQYFQGLEEIQRKYPNLNAYLVVGLDTMEESKYGSHDAIDIEAASKDQADKLRYIVVTPNRETAFAVYEEYVTCGLWRNARRRFTPSHANRVITTLNENIEKSLKDYDLPSQYDNLLGLTCNLLEYRFWLYINEYFGPGSKCQKAIRNLGLAWKGVLSQSDDELQIDSQYTRPGTVALLQKFKKLVSSVNGFCYDFPWK